MLKKIGLFFPILFFVFFFFIRCEKQQQSYQKVNEYGFFVCNNSQIKSLTGNWLCFDSRDSYVQTIEMLSEYGDDELEDFDESFSFQSMLLNFDEDEREEMGVYDDLLASILNPSGVIQINDTIYSLNFKDGNAVIMNAPIGDTLNVVDLECSFWDTVSDNKGFSSPKSDPNDMIKATYTYESGSVKVKSKIAYQRALIYFSLIVKSTDKSALYVLNGAYKEFDVPSGCYYRKKNQSSNTSIEQVHKASYGNSITYRPYSGTKQLKKFSLSASFHVDDFYDDPSNSYYLSINK